MSVSHSTASVCAYLFPLLRHTFIPLHLRTSTGAHDAKITQPSGGTTVLAVLSSLF